LLLETQLTPSIDGFGIFMYKASVILPVYNESETIERTLLAVKEYALLHPDFYFLFVNDGSTDNTGDIIRNGLIGAKNISLLNLEKNKGKANALKHAVAELDSDYIVFNDGDLAYSLDHVDALLEALKSSDVAIGNRKLGENHPQKAQRFIAGEAFNKLARLLLSLSYTDTQAGIKGFTKEAAKKLFKLSLIEDFAFDAELLYIAKLKGYRISLIPARVDKMHQFGPSTIKVVRDSPGMFLSLIKIIFYRIRGKYNE
jgi:dolichyl-phosphate beta-glucosyltransferase